VKIYVIGAGQVGSTIVEALHNDHDLTVIDVDQARLTALSSRFDVATFQGNGASRRTLNQVGIGDGDLFIACTSRDEVNIIAAIFARSLAPRAKTIARTTDVEYLEVWHERELDVDFIVSSELETAHAVTRLIGIPAARQTDVFAEGQVQMVEFDVPAEPQGDVGSKPLMEAAPQAAKRTHDVIGVPLRDARIPRDAKVAGIIRGDRVILPRGDVTIHPSDRVVVIGSPAAAREWSELLARGKKRLGDVVVFGAGRVGVAIAKMLISQGSRVRLIEASRERATTVADEVPEARVFNTTGLEPDFLERERIGQAEAGVFAMRDDAKNHYAATLAKMHGLSFAIAIVHDAHSVQVLERAGIDVAVNPRLVTAEEMVRFAHDPRTQQVAMLEGDRFEILDITVSPDSEYIGKTFRDMPIRGALIGAIVRNGSAIFPHGDDVLEPGDRVIVFTESSRVPIVEKAL
jgi:trk system potassium uptake protein TrkA